MYSKDFIDELTNSISLSSVIGKQYPLKKKGRDFMCCCPFHSEKTPSFSISDDRKIYKCFGCGKSGNIFTFVQEIQHISFKEAVEYLATEYSIPLPKLQGKEKSQQEMDEYKILYDINEEVCKFFEMQLKTNFNATNYARKRGMNDANIKKFRIGFASDSYSALTNYMKKKGYKKEDLLKAGVIKQDENGYRDKFKNRLMFPVFSKKGEVIAFQGRDLDYTKDSTKPKYLNSPETKIFIKGNTLFNYYFAKKAIYDDGYAILVEGNMDALSLSINGVENVVAPMGTGVTEQQIKEILRITNELVICFDGDDAGQKAMVRLSELVLPLLTIGKQIKFAFLSNIDPDDFIKRNGKTEFLKVIKRGILLSDFMWKKHSENLDIAIPEQKAMLQLNLNKLCEKITDNVLRKDFEKYFRDKINPFYKRIKTNFVLKTNEIIGKSGVVDKVEIYEKNILARLVKFPNIVEKFKELSDNSLNDYWSNYEIPHNDKCFEFYEKFINDELLKAEEIADYLIIKDDFDLEKSFYIVKINLYEIRKELLNTEFNNVDFDNKKIINNDIKEINKKINDIKLKEDII